jgi:hypothetical protein
MIGRPAELCVKAFIVFIYTGIASHHASGVTRDDPIRNATRLRFQLRRGRLVSGSSRPRRDVRNDELWRFSPRYFDTALTPTLPGAQAPTLNPAPGSPDPDAGQSEEGGVEHGLAPLTLDDPHVEGRRTRDQHENPDPVPQVSQISSPVSFAA